MNRAKLNSKAFAQQGKYKQGEKTAFRMGGSKSKQSG